MQISEIKTEDGVKLDSDGSYYMIGLHPDEYLTIDPKHKPWFCPIKRCIHVSGSGLKSFSRYVPIVNGRAVGLWADRTTLETGLGRGA